MYPQANEIEEVGQAFITLGDPDYNEMQQDYLNEFLKRYAQDLNENSMKEAFKDKIEVIDAITTLHNFANQYHNEEDIFNEFKAEIEDLLILLHNAQGTINL